MFGVLINSIASGRRALSSLSCCRGSLNGASGTAAFCVQGAGTASHNPYILPAKDAEVCRTQCYYVSISVLDRDMAASSGSGQGRRCSVCGL